MLFVYIKRNFYDYLFFVLAARRRHGTERVLIAIESIYAHTKGEQISIIWVKIRFYTIHYCTDCIQSFMSSKYYL